MQEVVDEWSKFCDENRGMQNFTVYIFLFTASLPLTGYRFLDGRYCFLMKEKIGRKPEELEH
jgi:hypothetical protein